MHSILYLHPNSLRTKTLVEGVSVLQSRTMIHVAMIPNHKDVISFWGKTRGQPICNCYSQLVHLKIKFFVNTLPLSPMNEDLNNPGMCTKQQRDMLY